jgi:hypothetical protein
MMKLKMIAAALASAGALAASVPAHAGALAMADLTILGLGLTATNTGTPAGFLNAPISIKSELRTGNATSSFNGVQGVNGPNPASAPSLASTVIGATVDVRYRCAGDCGPATQALYAGGGGFENNTTTHLGPVPGTNFALADMLIQGSALSGPVTGLTRANAQTFGGTNEGSANATILNSVSVNTTFTALTTFSAYIAVNADAFVRAWVNFPALDTEVSTASAAIGWNLGISGPGVGAFFAPTELNRGFTATDGGNAGQANQGWSFNGFVYSTLLTFTGGETYTLTLNQSSNAIISNFVPEPASLALVGLALIGAGVASRRHRAV